MGLIKKMVGTGYMQDPLIRSVCKPANCLKAGHCAFYQFLTYIQIIKGHSEPAPLATADICKQQGESVMGEHTLGTAFTMSESQNLHAESCIYLSFFIKP